MGPPIFIFQNNFFDIRKINFDNVTRIIILDTIELESPLLFVRSNKLNIGLPLLPAADVQDVWVDLMDL